MAQLSFQTARIAGVVTTVGGQYRSAADLQSEFGFSDTELERLQKTLGLQSRYVAAPGVTTSDLCLNSAHALLAGLGVAPDAIDAVIMVTQTPDFRAPSTAIHLAHRLGCNTGVMAFDIALGCSGYVYGLNSAFALVNGGLRNVLLVVGDVASRFAEKSDRAFAPLMGDAGAATLITRADAASPSSSHFCLHSDGAGYRALYMPGSGVREEAEPRGPLGYMHMNGAEVFNFTIKVVPSMFSEIFAYAATAPESIDYFVLHQPNKYILHNIQKRLGLPKERVPDQTQAIYGNQNSASIPGTINGFLSEQLHGAGKTRLLLAGFGIGLSWGAAVLEVDGLYAPPVIIDERKE